MLIRHLLQVVIFINLVSCFQEPEFANEPNIEFVSIQAKTISNVEDSITITVSFQDGDGNLGLDKGEGEADANNSAFKEFEEDENGNPILDINGDPILNRFRNNFFLEVLRENDGNFQLIDFPETQTFNGFFPRLNTSDKDKAIEGEISYTFILFYDFTDSPLSRGDEVKFQVQIVDREKNFSNTVETEPVIVGES